MTASHPERMHHTTFFNSEIPAPTLQHTHWLQLCIVYDNFTHYATNDVPKIITPIVCVEIYNPKFTVTSVDETYSVSDIAVIIIFHMKIFFFYPEFAMFKLDIYHK